MAKIDEMLINSILPHDLNHGNYGKLLFTAFVYFQEEWGDQWALRCHCAYQIHQAIRARVFDPCEGSNMPPITSET
jgi:hypothetical protein